MLLGGRVSPAQSLRLVIATFLFSLCAFAEPGWVDPSFGALTGGYATGTVTAAFVQEDGRVLLGGPWSVNFKNVNRLVRLMPDGSLDLSFANACKAKDVALLRDRAMQRRIFPILE